MSLVQFLAGQDAPPQRTYWSNCCHCSHLSVRWCLWCHIHEECNYSSYKQPLKQLSRQLRLQRIQRAIQITITLSICKIWLIYLNLFEKKLLTLWRPPSWILSNFTFNAKTVSGRSISVCMLNLAKTPQITTELLWFENIFSTELLTSNFDLDPSKVRFLLLLWFWA